MLWIFVVVTWMLAVMDVVVGILKVGLRLFQLPCVFAFVRFYHQVEATHLALVSPCERPWLPAWACGKIRYENILNKILLIQDYFSRIKLKSNVMNSGLIKQWLQCFSVAWNSEVNFLLLWGRARAASPNTALSHREREPPPPLLLDWLYFQSSKLN